MVSLLPKTLIIIKSKLRSVFNHLGSAQDVNVIEKL